LIETLFSSALRLVRDTPSCWEVGSLKALQVWPDLGMDFRDQSGPHADLENEDSFIDEL
jgi:hypothetical protein